MKLKWGSQQQKDAEKILQGVLLLSVFFLKDITNTELEQHQL